MADEKQVIYFTWPNIVILSLQMQERTGLRGEWKISRWADGSMGR